METPKIYLFSCYWICSFRQTQHLPYSESPIGTLERVVKYADDSTIYWSCKINQKYTCIKELEKDCKFGKKITSIVKWSIETSLVFDIGKIKFMLLTTKHTPVWHKLRDEQFKIYCNGIKLEKVSEWKLLGITIDENLALSNHIPKVLKNSYLHLSVLRYTSQDLPQYQIRTMIKLQKSCTSFG